MKSRVVVWIQRAFFFLAIGSSIAGGSRAAAAEYLIQPQDVLSVQVSGEPDLSKNYTVDDQGDIALITIGKAHVGGLSSAKAEEALTKVLKQYLNMFEVAVSVFGDHGGTVLVYGEVAHAGSIKLGSKGRLLDVLAEAGQPTANADTHHINIIRSPSGKTETVDLDTVLKNRALDVALNAGDTVTVPARASFSVQIDGEVQAPGLRALDMFKTPYAAILSAGPGPNTDWTRITLHRNGSTTPLTLDLSKVRTGQAKDDITLEPGDQITVASRFMGTVTMRGEIRIPGEKPLDGKKQLLDFITTAGGGFTDAADRSGVQILRDGQPPLKIDLDEVINGGKTSDDPSMEVKPGDVIFVPSDEKRRFAIIGGVVKPGAYRVKPGMKILDAVFAADGFSANAGKKDFLFAPADPADPRLKSLQSSQAPKARDPKQGAPGSGMALLSYDGLVSGGQNIPLAAGDRIVIPQVLPKAPGRGILQNALQVLPFASLLLRAGGY